MITLSFISADYVARANGYDGSHDWGHHDRATIESMNSATFRAIAGDVQRAGFTNLDLWSGHCHYRRHAESDYPEQVVEICREHGLRLTSYAGGMPADTREDVERFFGFVKRIGAPLFAGGTAGKLGGDTPAVVNEVCEGLGLKWAYENHAEKSVEQVLARIGGGQYPYCGVALDTGFCGTHDVDALEWTKALLPHLFILHLKDVRAAGGHETCAIGEGVVNCEGVVRYLHEAGWHGDICIEHEPYDHDPMPEIVTSVARVREWLS